jgi:diguanylate cyclase (GGDEF)-like protein
MEKLKKYTDSYYNNIYYILSGIFPFLYLLQVYFSSGINVGISFILPKILLSSMLLTSFFICTFNKTYKRYYQIYVFYVSLFIIFGNTFITIINNQTNSNLYMILFGFIPMLAIIFFEHIIWFIFYSIYVTVLYYIFFNIKLKLSFKESVISTMVLYVFFIFGYVFVYYRSKVNKQIQKLGEDKDNILNQEATLNRKLEKLNLIYEGVIDNADIQIAILHPHTYVYKMVNPKTFDNKEVSLYIIEKDDIDYCKYVKINHNIAIERIKKIAEAEKSKYTSTLLEKITFLNNQTRYYKRSYTPIIKDGIVDSILMIGQDVTSEQIRHNNLKAKIKYDNITNVFSRDYSLELTNELIESNSLFTLIFVDLDNFKTINDNYGHDEGDLLLKQFGLLLNNAISKKGFIGRLGGDEFIIILKNIADDINIKLMFDKIYKNFKEITINEKYKNITFSAGVVKHPTHGENLESLLKLADKTMYNVKHNGKNKYKLFTGVENE